MLWNLPSNGKGVKGFTSNKSKFIVEGGCDFFKLTSILLPSSLKIDILSKSSLQYVGVCFCSVTIYQRCPNLATTLHILQKQNSFPNQT